MNLPKIVCPNNPGLLRSLSGRTVVVKVKTMAETTLAADTVIDSGNELHCVLVQSDIPLAEVGLQTSDEHVPVALAVPAMGNFRDVARRMDVLKRINLRIFIPCDSAENGVAIRVLSSLGIETCVVIGATTNWDALTDLMIYAVLDNRVPHGAIQPFAYMASAFDGSAWLDWSFLYFDGAANFLHLDSSGRVAFSDAELKKGQFVASSLQDLEAAGDELIMQRTTNWKHYFLENHACTACTGWRLCLGKFSESRAQNPGCAAFFQEMIDVARQHRAMSAPKEGRRLWQL
jgi:hypothetical protein